MSAPRSRNLRVNGQIIECVPISEFAKAISRSPITVRSWQRSGLLPRPYVIHAGDPRACRRYYPLEFVCAAKQIAEDQRWGSRRPSGHDEEHARALFEAWDRATSSSISNEEVRFPLARNIRQDQPPWFSRDHRSGIQPARQIVWRTAETVNQHHPRSSSIPWITGQ